MAKNLYEHYTSQGKTLPSVAERAPIYEAQGLGKATDYTGTEDQNTALLGKLQGASTDNLVTTSDTSRKNFSKNSAGLDSMLNRFGLAGPVDPNAPTDPNATDPTKTAVPDINSTTDPYISGLNSLAASSDKSAQILIKNIQANKQRQTNKLDKEFGDYKGGLQLLGIQTNAAAATPELLAGHIHQAEQEHQDKLAELDSELAKTLAEADQARNEKKFSVLKEKMDYIKQLKSDQINTLKDLNDTLSANQKNAAIEAHEIYDSFNTLSDVPGPDGMSDKERFLQALSRKWKIPVTSLVTALVDEKAKRETADITLASKQATLNKKVNPTTTTVNSAQIKQGEKFLTDSKGPDGYVDPDAYKSAYDQYPGTKKDFLTKFPPNNWVNPENTTLPQYLRSTKKGGKTTTTKAPLF